MSILLMALVRRDFLLLLSGPVKAFLKKDHIVLERVLEDTVDEAKVKTDLSFESGSELFLSRRIEDGPARAIWGTKAPRSILSILSFIEFPDSLFY